jgi:hypothetical protein
MPVGVNAYIPLANLTLATSVNSVLFSSIPGTYRDLVLVFVGKSTNGAGNDILSIQINGDTGSNYTWVRMNGDGSATDSFSQTSTVAGVVLIGNNSSPLPNAIYQFMDYSATDKHKTFLGRGNDSSTQVSATASRWANTAALTSIRVFPNSGSNYSVGSTFNLFGIAS